MLYTYVCTHMNVTWYILGFEIASHRFHGHFRFQWMNAASDMAIILCCIFTVHLINLNADKANKLSAFYSEEQKVLTWVRTHSILVKELINS